MVVPPDGLVHVPLTFLGMTFGLDFCLFRKKERQLLLSHVQNKFTRMQPFPAELRTSLIGKTDSAPDSNRDGANGAPLPVYGSPLLDNDLNYAANLTAVIRRLGEELNPKIGGIGEQAGVKGKGGKAKGSTGEGFDPAVKNYRGRSAQGPKEKTPGAPYLTCLYRLV